MRHLGRFVGETFVIAVGATVASVAFVTVGAARAVFENLTMAGRVRGLRAEVDELEGRIEVVYADHEAAVDAELTEILGEG